MKLTGTFYSGSTVFWNIIVNTCKKGGIMDKYLLGINNGKNEVRCAIFNTDGRMIASAIKELSVQEPQPGYAQRGSEETWQANIFVIREVLNISKIDPSMILCIGITACGNGVVFLDAEMKEVCPMVLSGDTRAEALCKSLKEDLTERKLYPLTRSDLRPSQTSVILKWFRIHQPEILEKTRWILSIKDLIRYKLTGEIYGELTEASSTGLLDLNSSEYEPYIFETLDIASCYEKMPKVLDSITIAGHVNREASLLTGLKEGTPVTAGYFDLDAEALASGILSDEELCMIADTWSINEFLVGSVSDNYDRMTNRATLSYVKGLYLMEDLSPSSHNTLNRCIRKIVSKYAPEIDEEEDLNKKCDVLVARRDPQKSEAIFIPYHHTDKKDPELDGVFVNLREDDDYVSLLRAAYEGVIFSTIHHIRNLKRPVYTYTAARLSGGIADSAIWAQILADTLQLPIQTIRGNYIGSKGAAIGAGIACGVFEDLEDGIRHMVRTGKAFIPRKRYAPIYQKKYEAYESALMSLLTEDKEHLEI